MKPVVHTIVSGGLSIGFWAITRSWRAVLICFLCGILIDIDHVFDYILAKRRMPGSLSDLESYCSREKEGKLYLIFHSYEIIVLLWMGVIIHPLRMAWWAFAVGMTVHMLLDNFHNPYRPYSLFFIRRLYFGFEKKSIYPEGFYKDLK